MSATVDFGRFRALVRGGYWRLLESKDRATGRLMVAFLNDHVEERSTSHPDWDLRLAELAARELGGKIVAADAPPDFDPGLTY